MKFRQLLVAVAIVLISLLISTLSMSRTPLTACEVETFLQNQSLIGNNLYMGRMITLVLTVITVSSIYCLSRTLYGIRTAVWTLVIICVLPVPSLLLRGGTLYSWIMLLSILSTTAFYYSIKNGKYLLIYIPVILSLCLIHPFGLFLVAAHLLYFIYYLTNPLNVLHSLLLIEWAILPFIAFRFIWLDPLIIPAIVTIPLVILLAYSVALISLRAQMVAIVLLAIAVFHPDMYLLGHR